MSDCRAVAQSPTLNRFPVGFPRLTDISRVAGDVSEFARYYELEVCVARKPENIQRSSKSPCAVP